MVSCHPASSIDSAQRADFLEERLGAAGLPAVDEVESESDWSVGLVLGWPVGSDGTTVEEVVGVWLDVWMCPRSGRCQHVVVVLTACGRVVETSATVLRHWIGSRKSVGLLEDSADTASDLVGVCLFAMVWLEVVRFENRV
jgi:hypothetical protein